MNELDKIHCKLNKNIEDDEEYVEAEHDAIQQYCEDHNYKMTDDEMETIRAFGYEESFNIWVEFNEGSSENEL